MKSTKILTKIRKLINHLLRIELYNLIEEWNNLVIKSLTLVLPPPSWRGFSIANVRSIDRTLANICMSSPPNSCQDSAANALKKEIFHQMNLFLSDCCFRHHQIPPSMPIQNWMTAQSPRKFRDSKALAIRLQTIYLLSSTILDLQFQRPLKNRSMPKRTNSCLFLLVTKEYVIPLRRSLRSKSFKNLVKVTTIKKDCSNDSLMTNISKQIITPRQLTIKYWSTRRSKKDSR